MFAPMTSNTEFARFEAEMHERQRRAALLANAQLPEGYSLLHDVIRSFTDWALRRRTAAEPAPAPLRDTAADCC